MGAHKAGRDLTEAITVAPHNKEVFSKIKQVGILV
jgi:predicted heme/steroid binding protein